MPLIGLLLSRVGAKIWLGLAIALAVLAVLAGVRRSGVLAERAATNRRALEIKDAQLNASARSPRTRDALVDELRRGKF